jgi:cyclic pyranopterin phosphate synthase
MAPSSELPSGSVPDELRQAFAPVGPLDDAVWASLTALDRYALGKVAERGRADRIAGAYAEIVGQSAVSTHLAAGGGARMVDVGPKPPTLRRAVAESRVSLGAEAYARLSRGDAPKGDVLGTARLAGILAAKRTPDLVPLCHPVALTHVEIDLRMLELERAVAIQATVEAFDRTGVEMEALAAASAAALTVYDMLKAFDRSMEIGPTRLIAKSGGRSGDFRR